jgi:hypothetical protein
MNLQNSGECCREIAGGCLKTESKNVKAVIPGMNAIAFTREVRALARLEGWCSALCVRPSFEARQQARTSG